MLGHMGRAVVKLQANGVSRLRVDGKRYHAISRGTADAAGKKAGKTKVRNTDQKAVLPCKDGVLPFLFSNRKAKKQ